jgi:hypothetical protein
MNNDIIEAATTTSGFASIFLGLRPYLWQAKSVLPLEKAGNGDGVAPRVNISVIAPNGSGKDLVIIPTAIFWWLAMFKKGQVIVTTKSELQLDRQTLPNIRKHYSKFGYDQPVESPRFLLKTPEGGYCSAFVSKDPSRIEGWHEKVDEPLLIIVNEAATVDQEIFTALDRCTPTAVMLVSKGYYRTGRFFDTHHKFRKDWQCIHAGLTDCPHIPKSKIDFILNTYGKEHPVTRSTLYGEFMDQMEGELYTLTREDYLACLDSPPKYQPGTKCGFFDFGAGVAEHTFVIRDGNRYTIADAWHEKNEDATVGRAIWLIRQNNLKPSQVAGDAAAKGIIDKMAASGCSIGRQNFGAKDASNIYQSWAAKAWIEGCQKIKNREVIIPEDVRLQAQCTTRKKFLTPAGKWALMDKDRMQDEERLESPDRADALFGAMSQPAMPEWDRLLDTNWNRDIVNKQPVGARVGL